MADLNYTVGIEATGAQATLTKLNKQVSALDQSFGALKAALAGIAFGSLIANANKFADSISDMSDATEIAIGTILGFSSALMQNGGDAEAASNSIGKFTQTIGDAINGSDSAQKAFADVGISLRDIQTLSSEDLLKKTVQGLGSLESSAKRITTQVALFGKAARSVNFEGVSGGFASAVESSQKYSSSIAAGAAAQQSLEVNLKNLTMALLRVVEPLNSLVGSLNISVSAFESLIKVIFYAGSAYLVFTRGIGMLSSVLGAIITPLKSAGGLMATLGAAAATIGRNFVGIFVNIGRGIGAIQGGTSFFVSMVAAAGSLLRVLLRFAGIVGVIMAVAEAVNFLSKQFFNFDILDVVISKFGKLYESAKKYFNLGGAGAGGGRGDSAESIRLQIEYGQKLAKEYDAAQAKAKEFADRQEKLSIEIKKVGQAMAFTNARQLEQLALETKMIGMSEDQQETLKAVAQLYEKQEDAIKGLLETRAQWAKGTEEQQASLGIIDAQIQKVKELTAVQEKNLTGYIDRLQVARILEKDRLQAIEEITKQMERQASLGEILRSANDQMMDVKFQAGQRGKSPLEQQFSQIREDARKAAMEAGKAFSAGFEDTGDGLSSEKAKELAAGLNEIAIRYKLISDAQIANVEASRTFKAGWEEAFNSYVDNATNAANRARDLFSAVTNSMNSAIDRFVDNGKFSFSEFASSLIKDMIKIELKASAMNLMKMMGGGGGGGGFLSTIGSFLGFANGGDPPVGRASIVGENGPEIITPRGATTITPNGMGMGGATNYYITNNVSAIDAKGVAQLFAENRKALLGSVEAAKKELPYRTR
ncbi:MAG: phage tail tape measure C-terminal domain-containing protein [Candidatus Nanopelagicus sp.]